MSEKSPSGSPFLGGGPRFNQAGNNTPLPGEKRAETPPPPFFGGPRVWSAVGIVIVLLVVLFIIYGNGLLGVQHVGGHAPISASDKPDIDPDSN